MWEFIIKQMNVRGREQKNCQFLQISIMSSTVNVDMI